jgi:hypothetical protein
MIKIQAPPNASFFVGSSVYRSNGEGVLNASEEHVAALVASGCLVPREPWKVPAAPSPAPEPRPSKPEAPKVRLKAPRPHMTFAPDPAHSSLRYTANADRFIDAAPEHVKALLRAGCVRGAT